MKVVLLDPHGDDAALFAAYTCLREKPFVWVTNPTVPTDEVADAMRVLHTDFHIFNKVPDPDRVYAPAFHPDGHSEHNDAYHLARNMFPLAEHFNYCTYAPRAHRQTGTLVNPEPWMVARKLRALSCFVSQIEQESTRPWFTSLLDLREWYA